MSLRRLAVTLALLVFAASVFAADTVGGPGKFVREMTAPKGTYHIWVPKNYKKEKPPTLMLLMPNHMYDYKNYIYQFQDVCETRYIMYVIAKCPSGTWSRNNDKHILALMEDIKKDWVYDETSVLLLGNSESASDASLQIALNNPTKFTAVAVLAGIFKEARGFVKGPLAKVMPMYFEHGEKATDYPIAEMRSWVKDLEKLGANVTLNEQAGAGSQIPLVSTKSNPALLDWFQGAKAGNVKKVFDEAMKAKEDKVYGKAFTGFKSVVDSGTKNEFVDKAKKELADLQLTAKNALSDAQTLVTEAKYKDAMKALADVAKEYAGMPEGTQAATELEELKKSPKLKDQANRAKQEEAEKDAEKAFLAAEAKANAKEWGPAIRAYEDVATRFKDTSFGPKAAEKAAQLKADPEIAKELGAGEAKGACEGLMKKAENYRKNGMIDKAVETWKQVVEKYPDTEWATEAKGLLAKHKK